MAGKIIPFPGCEDYERFNKMSHNKMSILVQSCNMAFEKGILNPWQFKALLDYCGVDLEKDLTMADRAILEFHMEYYWNLDS